MSMLIINTPTCPGCKHPVDIVELCRHCGYEYAPGTNWWLVIPAVLLGVWAIALATWLLIQRYPRKGDNAT